VSQALRAAIYARVSTTRQRDEDTIGSQVALLQRYAAGQRWTVVLAAEDDGVSGAVDPFERPGMKRVIAAIDSNLVDVVLIADLDRLSRDDDAFHASAFRYYLNKSGVELWTPAGKQCAESFDEKLMTAFRTLFAAEERRKIRERTVRGRRHSIEQGGRTHGINIVGYVWSAEARALLPDPAQRDLVREVFRLAAEERLGPFAISRRLKERGLKGGRKTYLYEDAVKRILERETYYTGVYRPEPKSMPDLVRTLEPLVDEQVWFAANEALNSVRRPPPVRKTRYPFLLRGKVRCVHCGGAMTSQCAAGYFPYYRCYKAASPPLNQPRCGANKGIRADIVDEAVWSKVAELLRDPDALRAELERAAAQTTGSLEQVRDELARVEKEIQHLDADRRKLAGFLLRGVLTEDDVRAERQRIEHACEPLVRQREVLAAKIQMAGTGRARLNVLEERLQVLRDSVGTLSAEERAAVVQEVVDVVHLDTMTGDTTVEAIILTGEPEPPRKGGAGRIRGGGPSGSTLYGTQESSRRRTSSGVDVRGRGAVDLNQVRGPTRAGQGGFGSSLGMPERGRYRGVGCGRSSRAPARTAMGRKPSRP
jgi:site-specific DNA recombinase